MNHRDDHEELAEYNQSKVPGGSSMGLHGQTPRVVTGNMYQMGGPKPMVGYTETGPPNGMFDPSQKAATGPMHQSDYPQPMTGHNESARISGASTSSLPGPRPKADQLAPCLFKRKVGRPLPPVLGQAAPPFMHLRPAQSDGGNRQDKGFRH